MIDFRAEVGTERKKSTEREGCCRRTSPQHLVTLKVQRRHEQEGDREEAGVVGGMAELLLGSGDSEESLGEANWEEISLDPVSEVLTFTRCNCFSERNGRGGSALEKHAFRSSAIWGGSAKLGSYLDVKMNCHCSLCVQFQAGLD